MTETYEQIKKRQQKEFDSFPMGAAFSNEQFDTMMTKCGLNPDDTDKILSIGYGCFIRKSDRNSFHEMVSRQSEEMEIAMKDIEFFKSAVLYEMCNHEYGINMQADYDVINSLGFDVEYSDGGELANCTEMTHEQKVAYLSARKEYFRLAEEKGWY